MKDYLIKISVASFLVLMLFSCTKDEEFLTPGEKTAQDLNEIISSRGITSFSVYEYETYAFQYEAWINIISGTNADTEIVGSFLKIQDQYFNLDKLEKFSISSGLMRLYFR